MRSLMRAVQAALVASVLAATGAHAQARPAGPPAAPRPTTLPAMRAQPPASRRPAARPAARPATGRPVAQRPAAAPRPGVAPAAAVASDTSKGFAGPPPERWLDISAQAANAGVYHLPVGRGHTGPSVLHVQVLLNRAFFSSGMLDGRWGRNTQTAVLWFQAREGLPGSGVVDSATYRRLALLAGAAPTVRQHVLTADDVAGPFIDIPGNIYEHARLRCSCYESLTEKLTETFQSTTELLRKLNPGVELDTVRAGAILSVPAVRDPSARAPGDVRQIVVSGSSNYLQALDSAGRILYHFAATLGSSVDPSPDGDFRVTSIHPNPWWNYQPRLLAHVPDDRPSALIPPGPNNAVGRVWMSLSAPHYGIHGTKSPETIGYAESAGCVRLTNWDAVFLSGRVVPGTPVSFRDTRRGGTPSPPRPSQPAARPEPPRILGVAADSATADSAARPDTTRRTPPAAPQSAPAHPAPAAPPAADTARPNPPPARPATPPAPAPADTTKTPPRG
jgi:lipoprotein-anchoring transpeptidase ErfK/SrfK